MGSSCSGQQGRALTTTVPPARVSPGPRSCALRAGAVGFTARCSPRGRREASSESHGSQGHPLRSQGTPGLLSGWGAEEGFFAFFPVRGHRHPCSHQPSPVQGGCLTSGSRERPVSPCGVSRRSRWTDPRRPDGGHGGPAGEGDDKSRVAGCAGLGNGSALVPQLLRVQFFHITRCLGAEIIRSYILGSPWKDTLELEIQRFVLLPPKGT